MNIKLTIEYIGTSFYGWQKQANLNTVEAAIEDAIEKITRKKPKLIASGRTDAGVHALGQVVNFHTDTSIPPERLKHALNSKLNDDIRIIESTIVNESFHSRFVAKEKTYIYRIQTGSVRRSFEKNRSYYVKGDLDIESMRKQAAMIVGEHDFSAFKSEGSSAKKFVRTVYSLELKKYGDIIEMEITGNGFLYNMVRIIAGTLIEAGKGQDINVEKILESKSREFAGPTAPAMGLYLKKVSYSIDNEL